MNWNDVAAAIFCLGGGNPLCWTGCAPYEPKPSDGKISCEQSFGLTSIFHWESDVYTEGDKEVYYTFGMERYSHIPEVNHWMCAEGSYLYKFERSRGAEGRWSSNIVKKGTANYDIPVDAECPPVALSCVESTEAYAIFSFQMGGEVFDVKFTPDTEAHKRDGTVDATIQVLLANGQSTPLLRMRP